jgi:hypothetical protein
MSTRFQVELVWNREFDFTPYGAPYETLDLAIEFAKKMENMGDGASVKKTRVRDEDGNVVWAYGRKVSNVS